MLNGGRLWDDLQLNSRRNKDAIKLIIWRKEMKDFLKLVKKSNYEIIKIKSIDDVRIVELKLKEDK